MAAKTKEKTCRLCGESFMPWLTTQPICNKYKCVLEWNETQAKNQLVRSKRRRHRTHTKMKERTWHDFDRDAQAAFNRYIRFRDMGFPCHACGCQLNDNDENKPGAFVDASHYRSRGAASDLRFNVFNCVTCCRHCNRDLSGNVRELRKGLIKRFGLSVVVRLECHNVVRKLDTDYLVRLTRIFTRRADRLKDRREAEGL